VRTGRPRAAAWCEDCRPCRCTTSRSSLPERCGRPSSSPGTRPCRHNADRRSDRRGTHWRAAMVAPDTREPALTPASFGQPAALEDEAKGLGRSACWARRCSRRSDRPAGARTDLAVLEVGPARAEDEVIAAGDQAALEQARARVGNRACPDSSGCRRRLSGRGPSPCPASRRRPGAAAVVRVQAAGLGHLGQTVEGVLDGQAAGREIGRAHEQRRGAEGPPSLAVGGGQSRSRQ
jgi:hypothetical protein